MLEATYGAVETQVHLNQRWFADAYIPARSVYVEIDGSYWHRVDKSTEELIESSDLEGLRRRARDLEFNSWCLRQGLKLVRIDEQTAHKISSVELHHLIEGCTNFSSTY